MTKEEIRLEIKNRKEKLTGIQIEEKSRLMTQCFTGLTEYKNCSQLILYASFNQEVKTHPLINQALRDGKRVALPKVMGSEIEFFYIHSFGETAVSSMGIPEPEVNERLELYSDETNVILVPGLAFDREGNRIGYGKSYYDAYFAAHREEFVKTAFAYDFQVYNKLPAEKHDVRMDVLITETFLSRFAS